MQLLRLREGVLAVQEQGAGPGEQVDADQGEFESCLWLMANWRDGNRPNRHRCRCGSGLPPGRGCGDAALRRLA
jgi:hypothetical protein